LYFLLCFTTEGINGNCLSFWWIPLVEQELLTFPDHLRLLCPIFSFVYQWKVSCRVFVFRYQFYLFLLFFYWILELLFCVFHFIISPLHWREYTVLPLSVLPSVPRYFSSHFSDIWSQASYRYPISWEAFLDPSHSYFLFTDLVGFYAHWTYMRRYHKWALAHSSSCCFGHIIVYPSMDYYFWLLHVFNILFLKTISTQWSKHNSDLCSRCVFMNIKRMDGLFILKLDN